MPACPYPGRPARTPVILFVSDPPPERLAELQAAGANFFLSKDWLGDHAKKWQARVQEVLDQIRLPLKVEG